MALVGGCAHRDHAMSPSQTSPWEIADVFRLYGASYRQQYPVAAAQAKVIDAILACRTAQLGGHAEQCPQCGFERYAYNSCRNRHCPKCQTITKANWIAARRAELLPTSYYFQTVVMESRETRYVIFPIVPSFGLSITTASPLTAN